MTDRYGAHPDDYDPPVDLTKPASATYPPTSNQPYYPGAPGHDQYGRALNRTSSLAVTGFVLSLVSIVVNIFGLTPLVALIISVVALRRDVIQRGMGGRGFAIAGIVISALLLVLSVISVAFITYFISNYCTVTSGGSYTCNYNGSTSTF